MSVQTASRLSRSEEWSGQHEGIPFSIRRTEVSELHGGTRDAWAYYIYINERAIPDAYRDDILLAACRDEKFDRTYYKYMGSALAGLPWHYGITWYSKEHGHDGDPIVVKAGCDYSHAWDEGVVYDVDSVLADVHETIGGLWKRFPKLLVRSHRDGKWHSREELAAQRNSKSESKG